MQSDKYYGFYSNKTRGTRKAKGEATGPAAAQEAAGAAGAPPQTEGSPTKADRAPIDVRRNWARLIRRVFEVDPLICARCGGTMKVIGLIQKPEIVKRILDHLKLSSSDAPGRSPPFPATSKESTYEPLFDDLPWEEPSFEDSQPFDDGEPTFEADRPPDDEPIGDRA